MSIEAKTKLFFNEIRLIQIGAQRGAYCAKLGIEESKKLVKILTDILILEDNLKAASLEDKQIIFQKVEKYFGFTILDFLNSKD